MALARRLSPLSYAVRLRVVLKYLGYSTVAMASLNLVPIAVAILVSDWHFAARLSAVSLLLGSISLATRTIAGPKQLQLNEAMSVIALTFVVGALAMAWPLMSGGLSYQDAVFEAVSGITTTGLTTLTAVGDHSPAFLFARAYLQWVGGLGFVVFSVALFIIEPGYQARRLALSGTESAQPLGSVHAHARRILVAYVVITAIAASALFAVGQGPFLALLHALTAVSTGGFSPFEDSLAGVAVPASRWLVLGFCVAGAISLPLYLRFFNNDRRSLLEDVELRAFAGLAAISVLAVTTLLVVEGGRPLGNALQDGPVLALSALTTAGFLTVSPAQVGAGGTLLLIVLMAVGGCVGSTAGGIKVLRLVVIVRVTMLTLARTRLPTHAVVTPSLGSDTLAPEEVQRALMLALAFVATAILSWFAFLVAGHEPLASLFDVVSALGTVGLSTGVAAADLEAGLKWLLCLDMLVGRMEFIAVAVLLWPRTWIGRRNQSL